MWFFKSALEKYQEKLRELRDLKRDKKISPDNFDFLRGVAKSELGLVSYKKSLKRAIEKGLSTG